MLTMPSYLDEVTKAELIVDIQANPTSTCDEIVKLRSKYELPNRLQAVRNRHHYLKRVFKNNAT